MHEGAPSNRPQDTSPEDLDRDSLALSLDPDFLDLIREARGQVKRGEVMSLAVLKAERGEP